MDRKWKLVLCPLALFIFRPSNVSPSPFTFPFSLSPPCKTPSNKRSCSLSSPPFPNRSPSNSFQALDAYIQSQKALLARTQSDLDRLRRIRDQAVTQPDIFFDSLDEKVFLHPP
jgi:hypothetical protein